MQNGKANRESGTCRRLLSLARGSGGIVVVRMQITTEIEVGKNRRRLWFGININKFSWAGKFKYFSLLEWCVCVCVCAEMCLHSWTIFPFPPLYSEMQSLVSQGSGWSPAKFRKDSFLTISQLSEEFYLLLTPPALRCFKNFPIFFRLRVKSRCKMELTAAFLAEELN